MYYTEPITSIFWTVLISTANNLHRLKSALIYCQWPLSSQKCYYLLPMTLIISEMLLSSASDLYRLRSAIIYSPWPPPSQKCYYLVPMTPPSSQKHSYLLARIFVLSEVPFSASDLTFSAVHCDNKTCFSVHISLRMRFPQMISRDKCSGIDSLLRSNCFTWNTHVLMEQRMNLYASDGKW